MILIVANNNPYLSSSGVQKYIQVQDKAYSDKGVDSITVFPISKKNKFGKILLWGGVLRIRKKRFFRVLNDEHVVLLAKYYAQQINAVFIHHLKDVDLAVLKQMLMYCQGQVVFYVHDYYSCCVSVNLLKNGITFCGDSTVSLSKCKSCAFYQESVRKKSLIEDLFESVRSRLDIVAPSEICARYWSEAYPQFKSLVRVIAHQEYLGVYRGNREIIGEKEKVRIAFVGAGDTIKGVEYWKNAVERIGRNDDVEFFHFGRSYWKNGLVKNICVNVSSKNQDAMVSVLRDNKIHVAVLNSICPETYSFTYFEAFASNCFVVTNKNSGNIAKEVEKNKNGVVMADAEDLYLFISDVKKLKEMVNEYRLYGVEGPLNILPNERSFFPCSVENKVCQEKDLFSIRPTLFELLINYIYKRKYPFLTKND